MEQYFPAPGPTKAEFDTLSSTVNGLSDQIGNKSKINYIDITGSNSQIQVNSASGGVVSSANFISAYVVGNNSIVCLPYTYSGYVYVNLRSMSTMAEVGSGTYTVRVLYYS